MQQKSRWVQRHPVWSVILSILGVVMIGVVILFVLPFSVGDSAEANPSASYDESMARIEAIQASEQAQGDINSVCETNVIDQGEKTDHVIVFYHGFTSCPEQFRLLGEMVADKGYNVLIPRMPHHGNTDLLSESLIETSAEELASFTTDTIDIARGLGDEVIVAGLSGGGTLSAWIAQEHDDVNTAIMIDPFLGIGMIPRILNRPVVQILDNIPNIWMWWDPQKKDQNPNSSGYSYPRYPMHALSEYLRLGFATEAIAKKNAPNVNKLILITNANDKSVNNGVTAEFQALWASHGEELFEVYEIDASMGLPHDVITPERAPGNVEFVYPLIIDYIDEAAGK